MLNAASISSSSSSCFSVFRRSSRSSVQIRPLTVKSGLSTAERTRSSSSLYQVLGIENGATCREIKAAYRRLARVLHPDAGFNDGQPSSAGEFIKLHDAYETLSDPEKRAAYDHSLFWIGTASLPTLTRDMADSFGGFSRRTWETDQCW